MKVAIIGSKKNTKSLAMEIAIKCNIPIVVKSLPTICKNFIDGQCNECELNEHKECNG
jgi:hypothetical protein